MQTNSDSAGRRVRPASSCDDEHDRAEPRVGFQPDDFGAGAHVYVVELAHLRDEVLRHRGVRASEPRTSSVTRDCVSREPHNGLAR